MQKLLVWLGIIVVVLAVAAGVYLLSMRGDAGSTTVASATSAGTPTTKNPFGQAIDKSDPGEVHYRHGRYPEALAYWTEQAGKGNTYASYRLGVEYMDGKPHVVQRDYAKAMEYHRQAAMAGVPLSMFDIGSMFEYGQGVTKDMERSASWYGHSARYGLAQGQYNFATMLEAGDGISKDEVEAYKYFILAARGGFTGVPYDNKKLVIDRDAPLPTQLLERKLSKEQIADGRQRADTFRVTSGPLRIE